MSGVARFLRAILGLSRSQPSGRSLSPLDAPSPPPVDFDDYPQAVSGVDTPSQVPGDVTPSEAPPTPATPQPPARGTFGPYRILTELGRGGMGVVFKAEDSRLGRFVTLKLISSDHSSDPQAIRRFAREARAASALNHPNICTVYDVGDCDAGTFIVMEFLDGESLRQCLRKSIPSVSRLLKLAIQLAEGLAAAHMGGIVHRDIKPENLFVVGENRLKILDFGVAKLQPPPRHAGAEGASATTKTADTFLTTMGAQVGTFAYMSPEQARGEHVDSRSDLFSVGAVLFEMVTGTRAFARANRAETMVAVLTHQPVVSNGGDPRFRTAMQTILGKLLEKQPEFRYQHASDLAADLKRLERDLAETGSLISPLRSVGSSPPAPRLRSRITADLVRAAVFATLVVVAYGVVQGRASGKYLNQFQLAFVQENMAQGLMDEAAFEAGGRFLPVVVDISALHPDKRQRTDRKVLDLVVDELRRHGARAIGVDLVFDDIQGDDIGYFRKWIRHGNVRIGIHRRALEGREAWLGRPEFAALAAGIAVPADDPQTAYAFSRRWYRGGPLQGNDTDAKDCSAVDDQTICKEDLIQLPLALWLISENQAAASNNPSDYDGRARIERLVHSQQPAQPFDSPAESLEFGTFGIDYAHLKEIRRNIISLALPTGELSSELEIQLAAHRSRIADRVILVGDLEDATDQQCIITNRRPLPGALIHASALATWNKNTLFEPARTLGRKTMLGMAVFLGLMIVGLRAAHAIMPRVRDRPFQHLEAIVFTLLAVTVVVASKWLASSSGVVWPNFFWFSAGLALYPLTEPLYGALVAVPKMLPEERAR